MIKIILLIICFANFNIYAQNNLVGEWSGKIETKSGKQYISLTLNKINENSFNGILYDSNVFDKSFCITGIEAKIVSFQKDKIKILVEGKKMFQFKNTLSSIHKLSMLLLENNFSDTIIARISNSGDYFSLIDKKIKDNYITLTKQSLNKLILNENSLSIKQKEIKNISYITTKNIIENKELIPDVLTNRKNKIYDSIVLNENNFYVNIYDHGMIDGDSISVYFNKKLILYKQILKSKKELLKINLNLNKGEIGSFIIVAESLGKEPPNTVSLEIFNNKDILIKKMVLESNLFTNSEIYFYNKN